MQSVELRDRIEYLKNELRSYNEIKRRVIQEESCFDSKIAYYSRQLEEVSMKLESGGIKAIRYGMAQGSARFTEPILQLLIREEKLSADLNYYVEMKEAELKGYRIRLEYMDELLSKLRNSEREFIVEYYINHGKINDLERKLGISRPKMFRDKEKLLQKMLDF